MRKSVVFVFLCLLFLSLPVFSEKPVLTNISHPDGVWTGIGEITSIVTYSGATDFVYIIDKNPDTIPSQDDNKSITVKAKSGRIALGNKTDGEYYLHIRAVTSSGLSDTTHSKIMVDDTGPVVPQGLKGTALPDGTISLEWTPSTDDASGFSHYDIYRSNLRLVKDASTETLREFRITDIAVVKKIKEKFTENKFLDETVDKGKGYYYHYKIVATDKAGNASQPSPALSIKAASLCDSNPLLDVKAENDLVLISIASASEFKKGKVIVTDPKGKQTVLVDELSNITTLDTNFSIAGKSNGDYNVSFYSFDRSGDLCSAEKIWAFDNVNPEVKILSPENTKVLSELVRFELSATDMGENPSGIVSVSLFAKDTVETKIGDAVLAGSKYVFDWNTINFDNGRFTIIARAYDKTGNIGEGSKVYSIENTFYARVGADSSIASAQSDRNSAKDFIDRMKGKNIDTSKLVLDLARADSNILYAKEQFSKGNFEKSKQAADIAKATYGKIISGIAISPYGSGSSVYNENQMDVFLKAAGVSDKIVPESKSLIKKHSSAREVSLNKIVVGSREFYHADVTLTVQIDKNAKIKVVEVIPKKFTDDASEIVSSSKFDVLQKDPVIVFTPDKNSTGAVKFTYTLAKDLSKAQADALISSKVWSYYVAPPIVVNQSTDISSMAGSSGFSLGAISMPQFDFGGNTLLIGGIAVLFILFILFMLFVVAVVGVYFLFFKKKKGLK